jgi:hypothetical protein
MTGGDSNAQQITLIVLFNLVIFVLIEIPLLSYAISPDKTAERVRRFQDLLMRMHPRSSPCARIRARVGSERHRRPGVPPGSRAADTGDGRFAGARSAAFRLSSVEHGRSGISLFFLGAVLPLEGAQEGRARMSRHREFSDAALTELLRALRARSASRPDDPGLVASWPAVREDRMAAACAELQRRGHPVQRVSNLSAKRSRTGHGWAVGVAIEEPACRP